MNLPDYATVSSWRRTHRVRAITPNGGRLAVVSSPTRGPRLLARHGARAARCCRNGAVMPRGRAGDAESSMAPERAAALATVQLTGDSRANWTLDGRSGARRVAVELPALRSEPLLRRRMVEPARLKRATARRRVGRNWITSARPKLLQAKSVPSLDRPVGPGTAGRATR